MPTSSGCSRPRSRKSPCSLTFWSASDRTTFDHGSRRSGRRPSRTSLKCGPVAAAHWHQARTSSATCGARSVATTTRSATDRHWPLASNHLMNFWRASLKLCNHRLPSEFGPCEGGEKRTTTAGRDTARGAGRRIVTTRAGAPGSPARPPTRSLTARESCVAFPSTSVTTVRRR